MGGSARIVSVYFTTEEMDVLNALCKETTQTPQGIIKKSVMHVLREIERSKSSEQTLEARKKSEASTT
jgi:predicted DNA-binding protein